MKEESASKIRQSDTSTPEACVAVSQAHAPVENNVDAQRGSKQLRTAWMVNSAIVALNEPRGSSIQAIKKYMSEHYNIDTKKKSLFIKKYLISAVDSGVLYRTKGAGATGTFQVRKGGTFNAAAAAKTSTSAKKKLTEAFKKQAAAEKKLAETVKKQIEADKKLAEAAKKQTAADKKLAKAMKKLAAATKKEAAKKAAASVVREKNVNKESNAKPPNAKSASSQ